MKRFVTYLFVYLCCTTGTSVYSMDFINTLFSGTKNSLIPFKTTTTLAEIQDFLQKNPTISISLKNLCNPKDHLEFGNSDAIEENLLWCNDSTLATNLEYGDESALCALIPHFDNSLLHSNEFAQWLLPRPAALEKYLQIREQRFGTSTAKNLINAPLTQIRFDNARYNQSPTQIRVQHTLLGIAALDDNKSNEDKVVAKNIVNILLKYGAHADMDLACPGIIPHAQFLYSRTETSRRVIDYQDGYFYKHNSDRGWVYPKYLLTFSQGIPFALAPMPKNQGFNPNLFKSVFFSQSPTTLKLLHYLLHRGVTQEIYELIAPHSEARKSVQYLERPTWIYSKICNNFKCTEESYAKSLEHFKLFFENLDNNSTQDTIRASLLEQLQHNYCFNHQNITKKLQNLDNHVCGTPKEILLMRMLVNTIFPLFFTSAPPNQSKAIELLNDVLQNYTDHQICESAAKKLVLVHLGETKLTNDTLTLSELANKIFGLNYKIDAIENGYMAYKKYLQADNNSSLEEKYTDLKKRLSIYIELCQDFDTDKTNALEKYQHLLHEKSFLPFEESWHTLPPLLHYAIGQEAENALCFMAKHNLIANNNDQLYRAIQLDMPCLINEILKKRPTVNHQTLEIIKPKSTFITSDLVSRLFKACPSITPDTTKILIDYIAEHGGCNDIISGPVLGCTVKKPTLHQAVASIKTLDTRTIMRAVNTGIPAQLIVDEFDKQEHSKPEFMALQHLVHNALIEKKDSQLISLLKKHDFILPQPENPNTMRRYMRTLQTVLFHQDTTIFNAVAKKFADIYISCQQQRYNT